LATPTVHSKPTPTAHEVLRYRGRSLMDGAQDGPAYDPPKHRRPLTFSRWRSGEWPVIDRYAGQKEKTLTRKIPPPGLLFRTARHWNLRAEEMRSLAEEANDATVRRMMFRIAADYDGSARRPSTAASESRSCSRGMLTETRAEPLSFQWRRIQTGLSLINRARARSLSKRRTPPFHKPKARSVPCPCPS
jgi:hypothetical protein